MDSSRLLLAEIYVQQWTSQVVEERVLDNFKKKKILFAKLKDLDYGCIDMFLKDIIVLRIPSETLDYLSDGCKVPSSVTNSQHINLKLTQREK